MSENENGGWDEFDYEMDAGEVDASTVSSHVTVDLPGKYHMSIANVKVRPEPADEKGNPRFPDFLVTLEVLESVPGQSSKGALFFHNLRFAGKGGVAPEKWLTSSFSSFLCGAGVLKVQGDQVIDPETGSTKINLKTIGERLLKVGQVVAHLKIKKGEGDYPDSIELPWGKGIYQVDDDVVANVPKNLAALKAIGKESAAAPFAEKVTKGARSVEKKTPATTSNTAKQPVTPPTGPSEDTAAEEDFSDL